MGDGHHGWAAAEIILFLRDCIVRENGGTLELFGSRNDRIVTRGKDTYLRNLPTDYGLVSASLRFESNTRCVLQFENEFFNDARPTSIDVTLPFLPKQVAPSSPSETVSVISTNGWSTIHCSSTIKTLFIEI